MLQTCHVWARQQEFGPLDEKHFIFALDGIDRMTGSLSLSLSLQHLCSSPRCPATNPSSDCCAPSRCRALPSRATPSCSPLTASSSFCTPQTSRCSLSPSTAVDLSTPTLSLNTPKAHNQPVQLLSTMTATDHHGAAILTSLPHLLLCKYTPANRLDQLNTYHVTITW